MTRYTNHSRYPVSNCSTGMALLLAVTMFFVGVLASNYLDMLRFSRTNLESLNSGQELIIKRLERVEVQYQAEFEKKVAWVYTYAVQYNPSISIDVARTIVSQSYLYKNLNIELICALITHESAVSWDPQVRSNAGAIGLMQVLPSTGEYLTRISRLDITWTSAEEVLTNPIYNIRLGCFYLSMLIDSYGLDAGLACYNGPHQLGRQFRTLLASGQTEMAYEVLMPETREFLVHVFRRYNNLLKLTS